MFTIKNTICSRRPDKRISPNIDFCSEYYAIKTNGERPNERECERMRELASCREFTRENKIVSRKDSSTFADRYIEMAAADARLLATPSLVRPICVRRRCALDYKATRPSRESSSPCPSRSDRTLLSVPPLLQLHLEPSPTRYATRPTAGWPPTRESRDG